MPENLRFHFEGKLADKHIMNFYESARFQYAAARLLVKLTQFRKTGKFSEKISSKSNVGIKLKSLSEGSFNINVEDDDSKREENKFDIPLSDLVAFVVEGVVRRIDDLIIQEMQSSDSFISRFRIDEFAKDVISGELKIKDLSEDSRDLVKRRVAEMSREERLQGSLNEIEKIDFEKGKKLIAMSAPLIVEMATALRTSADSLEISSTKSGASRPILFLDRSIAADVETSAVDDKITSVLCDVIQFNKDNGWGKVRFEDGSIVASFNIPYDVLPQIKQKIIDTMKTDKVYLNAYFVRDRSDKIVRLMVVGILPSPSS
ncbi:hypothetical protein [Coralliovum pocilloporae]|uniref:hypothetical protein n=1 Tax=Coralliovum pocilloporae TaxID=3066369 RepID=UPI00330762DB